MVVYRRLELLSERAATPVQYLRCGLDPRAIMGARLRREHAGKNRPSPSGERDEDVEGQERFVPLVLRRAPHERGWMMT